MKTKNKVCALFAVLLMVFGILVAMMFQSEQYSAATSYTNAKEFYESTAQDGEDYHADVCNGSFYLATYAKLAPASYGLSSSYNLRYRTLGYDIELSVEGYSISFSVKSGESIQLINTTNDATNTYQYNLWCIPTQTLIDLAKVSASDSTIADRVLSSAVIDVRADAIMTTVSAADSLM